MNDDLDDVEVGDGDVGPEYVETVSSSSTSIDSAIDTGREMIVFVRRFTVFANIFVV